MYKGYTKDKEDLENIQEKKDYCSWKQRYFKKNTSSRIVHELEIQ